MNASPRLLQLEHGALTLPAFLPDATRAVIRGLDSGDLTACGVEGLVVSLFHLQTHPGIGAIASLGGINKFMNWPRPILSDSGGFQIYSLLAQSPQLGSVHAKGFSYRPASGVGKETLTPQKCIQKQFKLGADILVCLDHCTSPKEPLETQRQSVEHTILWARECRREFDRLAGQTGRRPILFAVAQGGDDPALRRECAERLIEIGFEGYAFGGWPVSDDGQMTEMVAHVAGLLPPDRPRWALGIGKPENVAAALRCGYDLFDCVIPTRDARHGRLYVWRDPPEAGTLDTPDFYDCVYIRDKKHIRAQAPLDEHCDCHCCRTVSLGYLRHLFEIRDTLGLRLATIHNLRFYSRLMELARR